jgi:hypothetical protein
MVFSISATSFSTSVTASYESVAACSTTADTTVVFEEAAAFSIVYVADVVCSGVGASIV